MKFAFTYPASKGFLRPFRQHLSTTTCRCLISVLLSLFLVPGRSTAQKQMERLNRGVVAVRTSTSQVYIGWRLFGNDPSGIGFNVYRNSTLLNASPITGSTNYK